LEGNIVEKNIQGAALAALTALSFAILPASVRAESSACDRTTAAAHASCNLQSASDFKLALGKCANLKSSSAREKCRKRAGNEKKEALELCDEQAKGRKHVCNQVGNGPFDPVIIPADFSTTINNPLLPMKPGSVYVYQNVSNDAEVIITVTNKTITLQGVTCIVVHDVNKVGGEVEEDTLDYYAQHKDGSVWYFGEDTISFEDGIASTEGSWRAGLDGAKPGIVMLGAQPLGKSYRQEFLLGEAEDVARTVAVNQHVEVPYGTFNNAFVTRDYTPIEPGNFEKKYYVPGVGMVLAHNPKTGEREELVSYTPGP
jgi:hypothetical protein